MNFMRLLPVIFSFLILSAHFYRADALPLAIIAFLAIFLLFLKEKWVARFTQILLLLGTIEWLRTLFIFVSERRMLGLPWERLVFILGGVAFFTGASTLVFVYNHAVKDRYGIE